MQRLLRLTTFSRLDVYKCDVGNYRYLELAEGGQSPYLYNYLILIITDYMEAGFISFFIESRFLGLMIFFASGV